MLAAFDHPEGSSWRKRLCPEYKANRPPKEARHIEQIELAIKCCRALGIHTIYSPHGEADDVIATAVTRLPHEMDVLIYTRDKDLYQLLSRPLTGAIWRDKIGWSTVRGAAAVREKVGVYAAQIADYLAIAGDSADNIKGCPGVGEVTAKALLAKYRNLSEIYDNLAFLGVRGADSVATMLRQGRTAITNAFVLVSLRKDLTDDAIPAADAIEAALVWSWRSANLEEFLRAGLPGADIVRWQQDTANE
jgi:5'-3' exonuclease